MPYCLMRARVLIWPFTSLRDSLEGLLQAVAQGGEFRNSVHCPKGLEEIASAFTVQRSSAACTPCERENLTYLLLLSCLVCNTQ